MSSSTRTRHQPWYPNQPYSIQPATHYSGHTATDYDPMAALTAKMAIHSPFGTHTNSTQYVAQYRGAGDSTRLSRQTECAKTLICQLTNEVLAVDASVSSGYSDSAHLLSDEFCRQVDDLCKSTRGDESAVMREMQTAYTEFSDAVRRCPSFSYRT